MALNEEELKKKINENIFTHPEKITEFTKKELENNPKFAKRVKNVIQIRGSVLEMAIGVEAIISEIIKISNSPHMIKKTFMKKVNFVKKMMVEVDKDAKHFDKEFFDKFDDLIFLRNLFAHVPHNPFSEKPELITIKPYDVFYQRRFEFKDIDKSLKYFIKLCPYIQGKMNILLKIIHEHFSQLEDTQQQ